MTRGRLLASLFAGIALAGATTAAQARLAAAQRGVLTGYLTALQHQDYPGAFARLSPDERRYFGSPRNLAAVFSADRLALGRFQILESVSGGPKGTVAVVRERVRFFDHAHQREGTLDANVRYGIVPGGQGPAIKDPFHPWYAFIPRAITAQTNGVSATLLKISFYSGRVEVLATFANRGDRTVTLLPYGRTTIRDDAGAVHLPVRSKLPGLTDATLFTGLRLAPGAQYTGAMTFASADRFRPRRLTMTFAPALLDGGDAPFEFVMPAIAVPPSA